MSNFLNSSLNLNDDSVISTLDELPLWSAPFGLALLKALRLRPNINALDIGFGTGFPLLELAQRLGKTSKVYGIDPWEAAHSRVRAKLVQYGITNVELINAVAEEIPFEDNYFDLIVSNNGINNVQDIEKVLSECYRVSRSGAQFVMTMNLPGTMMEFYSIYFELLKELGKFVEYDKLQEHIYSKRKPLNRIIDLLTNAGFKIDEIIEDSFGLCYLDGTTFFNHYFIRLAFMEPWKNVLASEDIIPIFTELENRLNKYAQDRGELRLNIPYVCINCKRI